MKIFLTVFALTFPLLAQRNYPPNIPTAQKYLYKTVGDTKLHLYAFMPKRLERRRQAPCRHLLFLAAGGTAGAQNNSYPSVSTLPQKASSL